jgi:hypothetical protein
MAVILTGRKLTIEVATVSYSAQVSEAMLVANNNVTQYITLTTNTPVQQPTTWQLRVRGFQDWGEAVSFCDAMWTAAAAGTAIAFDLEVDGPTANRNFTGNMIPVFVDAGGSAESALEFDVTFEVVGTPTKA